MAQKVSFSPIGQPKSLPRKTLKQSSLRKRVRKCFVDEDSDMVQEAPRKRQCDILPIESLEPVRRKLDFDVEILGTPMTPVDPPLTGTYSNPFMSMLESKTAVPKF